MIKSWVKFKGFGEQTTWWIADLSTCSSPSFSLSVLNSTKRNILRWNTDVRVFIFWANHAGRVNHAGREIVGEDWGPCNVWAGQIPVGSNVASVHGAPWNPYQCALRCRCTVHHGCAQSAQTGLSRQVKYGLETSAFPWSGQQAREGESEWDVRVQRDHSINLSSHSELLFKTEWKEKGKKQRENVKNPSKVAVIFLNIPFAFQVHFIIGRDRILCRQCLV